MKKDVSFYEVYGKVNYTFNDTFSLGGTAFWSPNFLNTGAEGTYASVVGKVNVPSTWFGSSGVGSFVSGEFGRQWLGTTDSFYGVAVETVPTASTTPTTTPGTSASASPTRCSRWTCATPTPTCRRVIATPSPAISRPRRHHAAGTSSPRSIRGVGSNWCGERFTAKLSADVTLQRSSKSFFPRLPEGRQSNLPPFLFRTNAQSL